MEKLGVYITPLSGGLCLLVGNDWGQVQKFGALILKTFGWIFLLSSTMAIGGGLFLSSRFLKRIETITKTAEAIIEGDIERRVPRRSAPDDLDRLAATLNRMLDRTTGLMESLKHLSNNIAHDLRTPLGPPAPGAGRGARAGAFAGGISRPDRQGGGGSRRHPGNVQRHSAHRPDRKRQPARAAFSVSASANWSAMSAKPSRPRWKRMAEASARTSKPISGSRAIPNFSPCPWPIFWKTPICTRRSGRRSASLSPESKARSRFASPTMAPACPAPKPSASSSASIAWKRAGPRPATGWA